MSVKTENTVKRLQQDLAKTSDPKLREAIKAKINALKGGKDILK